MRTLLLSEVFPPKTGGSGRWLFEIYRRMPRDQVRVVAGEYPRQEEFDRTHDLRLTRAPVLRSWGVLSWEGFRGYWRAIARLAPLVKADKIEQIHCGRCLPEGLMALALKLRFGIPFFCYAHGEELHAHDSRELRWLMRLVFRNADVIIANSRNTERLLREDWRLSEGRVHLLHPGVDTERFIPAAPDPAFRHERGWAGRRVVLTVGRLQKRKGHDMMIRALPTVRRAVPDVLYAIVGDGEELPELRRLVSEQGMEQCVQFLGEVDDQQLVRCYQQCDLFALPNRQVGEDIEGFGMVLVEAQACGKPVVAGASGGTAETMHVPATGRIVDCTAPDDLADVVGELLGDSEQRQRMGRSARERAVRHFDWAALAVQAAKIFHAGARKVSMRHTSKASVAQVFPSA